MFKKYEDFCKVNEISSKIWFKNIERDVENLAKNFVRRIKKI